MKKLFHLLTTAFLVLLCFFMIKPANAQSTATWNPMPGGLSLTTTNGAVGIGTGSPSGMQEIMYCTDLFNGLVITKSDCGIYNLGPNDFLFPTYDFKLDTFVLTTGEGGGGSGSFTPPITFILSGYGSSTAKPLFWARTENSSTFLSNASGQYTTRFIVTPYGRSGLNIENPRATLDIKSVGSYNMPAVIIGRQKLGTIDRTQHIHFVPLLQDNGYNKISKRNDQGLFFTDGLGTNGCNSEGAFIIAPWTPNDSSTSGLRMDAAGNVGIGTNNTGGYRLAVNGAMLIRNELKISGTLIAWPDYVFENYAYVSR